MISFSEILDTAILYKGSKQAVMKDLPVVASIDQLIAREDAFYLSTMMRRIFQAGLKASMVNAKWPAFERALDQFDPITCAYMTDEKLDELMSNPDLIRHLGKMKAVRINAAWVVNIAREHASVGHFFADWPSHNITQLWIKLKKEGAQLGGMSGPRFLRLIGKDTFLLTSDVVAMLKAQSIVSKAPTSQRDLAIVQDAFNQWQSESGLPLSHISRIASMTVGSWG